MPGSQEQLQVCLPVVQNKALVYPVSSILCVLRLCLLYLQPSLFELHAKLMTIWAADLSWLLETRGHASSGKLTKAVVVAIIALILIILFGYPP